MALLVFLSVLYYQERIIFTDTAYYAYTLAEGKTWLVPTNRYISLLSQCLPLAAIHLHLPLRVVLLAYSLNFILIPVSCAAICRYVFKNQAVALSILLFYLLMNNLLFYYPVSEFQMGLCLLFVYHAYMLQHFGSSSTPKIVPFIIVQLLLLTTIIFSHPLSVYVWLAWLIGLLLFFRPARKPVLGVAVIVAVVATWARDHFWPARVGDVAYDEKKKQGLYQFLNHPLDHYNPHLGKEWFGWIQSDYFMMAGLWLLLVILLLATKKRRATGYFVLVTLAFAALVLVSFAESNYNHYIEHLLQPLPFFIALFAGYAVVQWSGKPGARVPVIFILLVVCTISLAKINSSHRSFTERLAWYQRYLQYMDKQGIYNGALDPKYILFDDIDFYWADVPESRLLSSLEGANKTKTLKLQWNRNHLKSDTAKGSLKQGVYFLECSYPYIILDEFAEPGYLDQLVHPRSLQQSKNTIN